MKPIKMKVRVRVKKMRKMIIIMMKIVSPINKTAKISKMEAKIVPTNKVKEAIAKVKAKARMRAIVKVRIKTKPKMTTKVKKTANNQNNPQNQANSATKTKPKIKAANSKIKQNNKKINTKQTMNQRLVNLQINNQ